MSTPLTPAIHFLRSKKISFTDHPYKYEEKGGTATSARELNIPEHIVIKTLVFKVDGKDPIIVLMHGDREVSTKELARQIGAKQIGKCEEAEAQRHTGYMFGGTSPFGTRKVLPVYIESTILELPQIYINGGKRGFLVKIQPADFEKAFSYTSVSVAIT